jgi:hypothetical protein
MAVSDLRRGVVLELEDGVRAFDADRILELLLSTFADDANPAKIASPWFDEAIGLPIKRRYFSKKKRHSIYSEPEHGGISTRLHVDVRTSES